LNRQGKRLASQLWVAYHELDRRTSVAADLSFTVTNGSAPPRRTGLPPCVTNGFGATVTNGFRKVAYLSSTKNRRVLSLTQVPSHLAKPGRHPRAPRSRYAPCAQPCAARRGAFPVDSTPARADIKVGDRAARRCARGSASSAPRALEATRALGAKSRNQRRRSNARQSRARRSTHAVPTPTMAAPSGGKGLSVAELMGSDALKSSPSLQKRLREADANQDGFLSVDEVVGSLSRDHRERHLLRR
jgi:hypothetical protein